MTQKGAAAKGANAKKRLTTAAPMILSYNLNGAAASQALRSPPNGAAAQDAPINEVSGEEAVMLIGKRGAAASAISTADPLGVTVRGRDLAGELMGSETFTEFFFFLATGRMPSAEQRFFLDLALVAIAEHGLTPSVQAARMTYAADPAALQGAVAAGVLGCGTVILGAAREAGALLDHVLQRIDAGATPDEAADAIAREHRAAKKPLAGYGHPLHKPVDPRAERMIALARERGTAGRGVDAATRLTAAAARVWEKPLPMNVSMAIAATLRDADVPAAIIRGVPILARAAGLIAHLAEEAETPIGFYMASQAEEAIRYAGPDAREPDA
jgi:citrate synthase